MTLPALLFVSLSLLHTPSPPCADWQSCREQALAAAARGEHETFHDLAWRAMQTRGARDPELMLMLARAQSLSGRPHDALVMLRRLAEMGVAADAATGEDFQRVRALPGWAELEAAIDALGRPAPADPAGAPTSATAAVAAPPAEVAERAPEAAAPSIAPSEVARFAAPPFAPGGLAYDSASKRFVIGNLPERKLTVVGDGLNRAATLAGVAAGFLGRVAALEIDRGRGDLWVVSGGDPDAGGKPPESALHKLQLISGRVLGVLRPEARLPPARLVDVAVAAEGRPIVLDAEGPRLLAPGGDGQSLVEILALPEGLATSLTVAPAGRLVLIAYADRLLRADLDGRRVTSVEGDAGAEPTGLERIRWHSGGLAAVQVTPDGSRRIIRLRLSRGGARVVSLAALEPSLPEAVGPIDLAVFGRELYYLVTPAEGAEAVVRRVALP